MFKQTEEKYRSIPLGFGAGSLYDYGCYLFSGATYFKRYALIKTVVVSGIVSSAIIETPISDSLVEALITLPVTITWEKSR